MARMLTRSGLVSDEQLQDAMVEYARTGDPLGDILVSHGAISEDVLVAALSERYQLQRVGLTRFEPDYELARRLPEPLAHRLQAIPVAEAGETVLVAVTRPLADDDAATVERALGQPFRQLLANRTDVDQLVQRVHSEHYADVATGLLRETDPDSSAHVVTTAAQKAVFMVAAIVTVVCGVLWPATTAIALVGLCSALYLGVSLYRVRLTVRALGTRLETDVTDEELAALDERTLPVYTILVPLYREAGHRRAAGARPRGPRLPAHPARREAAVRGGRHRDRSRRSARCRCRPTSTSSSSPTRCPRPSPRPATTASSWPPAPTASSTTPRTGPTPTS